VLNLAQPNKNKGKKKLKSGKEICFPKNNPLMLSSKGFVNL